MEPEKDYNLTVGRRIREVREADRMTRAQFSEKCGISESFLAAVESGKKSITSKTLYERSRKLFKPEFPLFFCSSFFPFLHTLRKKFNKFSKIS